MSDPLELIVKNQFDSYRRQLCGILCVESCHRSILLELEKRKLNPESIEWKLLEARMDEQRLFSLVLEKYLGKPLFPDGIQDEVARLEKERTSESLALGYLRYESVRKLNPKQIEYLWWRSLRENEPLDALVDELIERET